MLFKFTHIINFVAITVIITTKNVLVNKLLGDGLFSEEQNEPGSTLPSS